MKLIKNTPVVKILTELPQIGIPNNPIVLYNGYKLLLCYEVSLSNGKYAIIEFENIIEYKISSINDQGLGKHKYAKYGMNFYSIHQVEYAEELEYWMALQPKYWIYCFKDEAFEIIADEFKVVEEFADISKLKSIMSEFTNDL